MFHACRRPGMKVLTVQMTFLSSKRAESGQVFLGAQLPEKGLTYSD